MTKIGFFSDVHGNIEALRAVLSRLEREKCDMLICLGDIVGYGANPHECIELLRTKGVHCLMGNHDSYACVAENEIPEFEMLRPAVQMSIRWTNRHLTAEDKQWLAELPTCIKCKEFSAVHASFANGVWPYCHDVTSMQENFFSQEDKLSFCGHSHSPLMGLLDSDGVTHVDTIHGQNFPPAVSKVMINVGAVGQPRDRDCRAAACIFDLEQSAVGLVREAYNWRSARQKILSSELPPEFGIRLENGI